MITPPRTLSNADAGASGTPPRFRTEPIQLHVPGKLRITPRAPTGETAALLNPLACHPIASASDGGTRLAAAIEPISPALTRWLVGYGGALCEPMAALPTGSELAPEVVNGALPPGSRSTVP